MYGLVVEARRSESPPPNDSIGAHLKDKRCSLVVKLSDILKVSFLKDVHPTGS